MTVLFQCIVLVWHRLLRALIHAQTALPTMVLLSQLTAQTMVFGVTITQSLWVRKLITEAQLVARQAVKWRQ